MCPPSTLPRIKVEDDAILETLKEVPLPPREELALIQRIITKCEGSNRIALAQYGVHTTQAQRLYHGVMRPFYTRRAALAKGLLNAVLDPTVAAHTLANAACYCTRRRRSNGECVYGGLNEAQHTEVHALVTKCDMASAHDGAKLARHLSHVLGRLHTAKTAEHAERVDLCFYYPMWHRHSMLAAGSLAADLIVALCEKLAQIVCTEPVQAVERSTPNAGICDRDIEDSHHDVVVTPRRMQQPTYLSFEGVRSGAPLFIVIQKLWLGMNEEEDNRWYWHIFSADADAIFAFEPIPFPAATNAERAQAGARPLAPVPHHFVMP